MASIDERIVSMAFNNKQFELGVGQTMASIAKLAAALATVGSVTGFSDIDKAASQVNLEAPMSALDKLRARLGGIGSGAADGFSAIENAGNRISLRGPLNALDKVRSRLGGVGANATTSFSEIEKASGRVSLGGITSATASASSSFSILAGAAAVALGGIATKAISAGAGMAKSLSFGPIMQGFQEYTTNLNSIQTILANTKASGAGLKDVNANLQELNAYSDKTIYNFSEMAKNIGTFTAAGVDLDTATQSIKGIANLAAVSGSNSQQASTAMYQLSQAISAGRVNLQDWNSVVNAGMGGTVFQRALATTAENMGTLDKGAVKLTGKMKNATINGKSFRESIMAKPGEESWLTKEVLTDTLQQFTGDMTDAELAAQGFTAEQIKAIQEMARTAQEAAQTIKTFPQLMDVVKESIGSGWALTFQTIFGDFEEAKKTFTELGTYITDFIGKNAEARNKVLADWKTLGGRAELIEGIKNIFKGLISVIRPIKNAFREIFPKKSGLELRNLTKDFSNFTEKLQLGRGKSEDLRRTFAGLFAVFHIGFAVIGGLVKLFGRLLGATGKGSGGVLKFTGSIGDFLVSVDKALTDGGLLTDFFDKLAKVIKKPLKYLGDITDGIFGMFDGADGSMMDKFSKSMDKFSGNVKPTEKALNSLTEAWEQLKRVLADIKDSVQPYIDKIGEAFKSVADVIADAFSAKNYDKTLQAIQTGLLGGIFLSIKKAMGGGLEVNVGALGKLNDVFGALTGNLKAMQQNVQATTLLKIAAAISLLAAGVYALSLIEPKALARSMGAIAIGLTQLLGAIAILTKIAAKGGGVGGILALGSLITAMIGLATAVTILAGATTLFSKLSWEELAKGLLGVAGAMVALGIGLKFMAGPQLIAIGVALVPIAIGMNLLALAVRQLSSISWEGLAKGLIAVNLVLVGIGRGLMFMPPSILKIGPGLIGIAIAINLLALAVAAFGSMNLFTLAKGIFAISISLAIISSAMLAMPPGIAARAAGLLVLAAAMNVMAVAVGILGGMGLFSLIKGIGALSVVLTVLGAGLTGMAKTMPGSAALLAAAVALAVLAPVLAGLGTLELFTIVKGLAAIAGILGVLALAGTYAAIPLKLLGLALLPLAGVLALTAASLYLFAAGLKLLAGEGAKGLGVLIAAMAAFVLTLPTMVINFMKGLVSILGEMAKVAPQIVDSLAKILISFVNVVILAAPKLAQAIGVLLQQFVIVIGQNAPAIITAGIKLLVTFLSGVANNIGRVTSLAIKIVLEFLRALTQDIGRLINAGAKFLVAFLGGIARNIGKVVAAAGNLVVKFLTAIAGQVPRVIAAGFKILIAFVRGVIGGFSRVIQVGVNAILKFMEGIASAVPRLIRKAVWVAGKVVKAIAEGLVELADVGFEAIIDFLNGMARVLDKRAPELRRAFKNLGRELLSAMTGGLSEKWPEMKKKIENLINRIPKKVRKLLGINSPSTVFLEIGRQTMVGLTQGISQGGSDTERAMEISGNKVVTMAKRSMGNMAGVLDGVMDLDPVIAPVLDLSAVHKEAGKLGYLTDVNPVVATASLDQASAISQEKSTLDTAQAAEAAQAGPSFQFEQNNYSPEALSDVEIYRKTNNQLSQVKGALGLVP